MENNRWLGYEISAQGLVVVVFLLLGVWCGEALRSRYGWENAPAMGAITGLLLGLLESILWFLKRLKSH